MVDLWAMSCAPASRAEEVLTAFEFAGIPENRRVLVTTQPEPIEEFPGDLLLFDSEEINLSKWWTLALDHIEDLAPEKVWDVLWLSSDVLFEPDHIDTVRARMRDSEAIMAGPDWHNAIGTERDLVTQSNNIHSLATRIPGVAFVIAGETGLRPDPEFRWWLADDDFEWTHRVNGGTVLVGGTTLMHLTNGHPLDAPRLVAWHEDLEKFRKKWGDDPFHGSPPL